jgi:hypothetical protein
MKETNRLNKEIKLLQNQKLEDYKPDRDVEIIPDSNIISSENAKNIRISSSSKINNKQSANKVKRRQLTKSVYELGIKKSPCELEMDFD